MMFRWWCGWLCQGTECVRRDGDIAYAASLQRFQVLPGRVQQLFIRVGHMAHRSDCLEKLKK